MFYEGTNNFILMIALFLVNVCCGSGPLNFNLVAKENNITLSWKNKNGCYYTIEKKTPDDKNVQIPIYNNEKIKVLNVYPDGKSGTQSVDFDSSGLINMNFTFYGSQTKTVLPKSALSKVLIEGGIIESNLSMGLQYKEFNHIDNLIEVKPATILDIEKFKLDDFRKFDIILFGFLDVFAGRIISNETAAVLRDYVELGYGLLLSDGTLFFDKKKKLQGFATFAKQLLKIKINGLDYESSDDSTPSLSSIFPYKEGTIYYYPYSFQNEDDGSISISQTSCSGLDSSGDIWYYFKKDKIPENNQFYLTTK